ncbi:hypothetical protein CEUSTIGMA_g13232.t1 [Chlamydomonas eustigma]|uniref:Uncharacterized protein n=1 Tax=Chlamydomonas eustigma TaxID=1157962 RepID=A0A250XRV3_9CHLO|nr:hypothetical protein CEUSTIGMA_g13232.t1 [Chlamydomonas eustigma]|eukprot:GAX85817.1 hypothetical protein CEUSTIGMA_g13232.t1 [Chlamydomonas eustigma]
MSRGNKLCLAPVDKYMARPSDMENLTMIEYLRKYDVSQIQIKRAATSLAGRDSRGGYVYEREPSTIVRFTDYNPKYSPEGFFYNLLVGKLPLRDEAMLMPHDQGGSYLSQCHLTLDPTREGRHILEDEEDLMNHVQEYSERHMYR